MRVEPIRDRRGFCAIGLVSPKTPANVGSALRAAGIFGASFVAFTGSRYHGAGTDTMKAARHLPLFRSDDLHSVVPYDCVPVAVDLVEGAESLVDYVHPRSAFYVFGPEDSTLGEETLKWCRDRVFIPAGCLNLAASVNVVLYDRYAKIGRSA